MPRRILEQDSVDDHACSLLEQDSTQQALARSVLPKRRSVASDLASSWALPRSRGGAVLAKKKMDV
ncbi:hypothetical protein Q0M94_07925 [Deinococcus radiomollis]|uniref:hypothetical protein n=1 Tax=Deinococcus radiomollis TaxID=468916 RepID=UPI003892A268